MLHQEKMILILGGCRSGKSEFAEKLALAEESPVYYLATGVVTDPEMGERVERHQRRRPAHWQTIEEPFRLAEAVRGLKNQKGTLLVDSLSGWLSNLLYKDNWENWTWDGAKEEETLERLKIFLTELQNSSLRCLIVGDEAGLGLVPATAEGRAFRDLNGRANQLVAAFADEVYFIAAGLPLKVK